ncbi:MAG TPA: dockerin type I domain-containing protein, partial [Lacipirellulaceae bacterium]|nr:dockerin type I domain-containing protein [Lacipirellulaceae bacterium]
SRELAESWIAMAGPLAAAFPSAIVSLNYATPTQAQITVADGDWLLEELADLLNGRAGYQANDLAADVDLERNKYQTLIEQQELGRHIGFQMVSSSGTVRFGGEFLEAVSIASQAGAQWLEMYAADIEHIPPTGDYNFDGAVDAADYVVWRKSLGQTGPGLAADGNGDHSVNGGDFGVWRKHFGEISPGASITSAVVPEPSTAMLIFAAMAISAGRRAAYRRASACSKLSS